MDKKDETLIKKVGDLDGSNFKIRNLENCRVDILEWTNGMFIDDCTNCTMVIGPCNGSIFIRNCKNCVISVVCKQLRFRDSDNVKIFAYCPSDPVVEASGDIFFAPFNAFFSHLKELFIKADFQPDSNKYDAVYDFSKDKAPLNKTHWEMMKNEDFVVQKMLAFPMSQVSH